MQFSYHTDFILFKKPDSTQSLNPFLLYYVEVLYLENLLKPNDK